MADTSSTAPSQGMANTPDLHYYAATTAQPDGALMVTGWYKLTDQSDPATHPELSQLTVISAEDWERQYTQQPRTDWQIKEGKLAPYTQTRPPLPLKEQAQNALGTVQQQATLLVAMGQSFGPTMRAYVQALQAIAGGTDTTSKSLPEPPAEPSA